ncbi:MAG: M6 family metalloprotease domain-containing protein [Candidatus Omnitrophota bacterium]
MTVNSTRILFGVCFISLLMAAVWTVAGGSVDSNPSMGLAAHGSPTLRCVSAKPGPISIDQPDGTSLTILLRGDEWTHFAQSVDGYTLLRDKQGVYRYAEQSPEGDLVLSGISAHNPQERGNPENQYLKTLKTNLYWSEKQLMENGRKKFETNDIRENQFAGITGSFPATGKCRFLIILVDFTDKAFIKAKKEVNNLMNARSGSFKQFYLDNSFKSLTIDTTVVGPFKLAHSMDYYGKNDFFGYDLRPREMIAEAVDLAAAAGVDFSLYDNNNDRFVDGIMVMHAGYGEEAGADPETIWSHSWGLAQPKVYNEKYIIDYTTVPELANESGASLTGVGVICHEFGHSLGAPDTYDTDYSESGGQAWDVGAWDVMASGSWNNNGSNPALHNPYTKWKLGWQTPILLASDASYTLKPAETNTQCYKFDTHTPNEFFLLENRQKSGEWDTFLPGHGLVIYHIDEPYIMTHMEDNINCDPLHQGIDVEEADNIRDSITIAGDSFPGISKKTAFTDTTQPNANSWDGTPTQKPITAISEKNKVITFKFTPPSLPPTASFRANKTRIKAGGVIYFYDQSTNNPKSWEWNFGGGIPIGKTTKNSQHPIVQFNHPGKYTISLKVCNTGGCKTLVFKDYIAVGARGDGQRSAR